MKRNTGNQTQRGVFKPDEGDDEVRQTVKCLNCGIKWVRVTNFGSTIEFTEDLMYNCPNCHSNYCTPINDECVTPEQASNPPAGSEKK